MSESESFIEEVSEEVRRDRLFKLYKKYGWVLAFAVLAIVGGTAYNEWSKSKQETAARLNGDTIQAATGAEALNGLASSGAPVATIALFQQANLMLEAGDTQGAVAALQQVAGNFDVPAVYSDLAALKILMLNQAEMSESERNDAYARLTAPDAPYRLLAQEQRAMQYVQDGDTEAAKAELAEILADPAVPPGLRNRAQQLMVALGGSLEADTANG